MVKSTWHNYGVLICFNGGFNFEPLNGRVYGAFLWVKKWLEMVYICVWSFFLGVTVILNTWRNMFYVYHCIPPRLDRNKICIDVTLAEHLAPFHGVNGMGKERSSCQTRVVVSCCFQSIVLLGADGWHVCEVQFYLSTAARRRTFFEAVKRGWSRCRPKVWLIISNLLVQN